MKPVTRARSHVMPFGAQGCAAGGARFRLWAPNCAHVGLCLDAQPAPRPMTAIGEGWFELTAPDAVPGTRYAFVLDNGMRVPDPASRYNPDDVHGASELIDPAAFAWEDGDWTGRPWETAVIYELHVGTFSPEGSFSGVMRHLDHLVELGITAIELMPVADFPGARDWGYDGVLPFAPDSRYGRPEDLKALVQAAHARGMMVLLDVVYNHFGPEGNYLHVYAKPFFNARHQTPWGAAINFDGANHQVVREFFIHNALYWLEEFHLDGLRLDAVHAIHDDGRPHFLDELAARVHGWFGATRIVHLVLENEDNHARWLGPARYRAQWNDDLHHALHVLCSGERDGYYADYADAPLRHLGRCLTEGFAYQGEPSPYRAGRARGEPSADLPPHTFVAFLQCHDQVGNRAFGERITALAPAAAVRAAASVYLLAPAIPMLFMGEEFGAATPFHFFCDFGADLRDAVTQGRRREFSRFARFADPARQAAIPDPNAERTFLDSRLDWPSAQQPRHAAWLAFYRHVLAVRRRHIMPRLAGTRGHAGAFEVLEARGLRVVWRMGDGARLHLCANLSEHELCAGTRPGAVIYASDKSPHDVLPAWGVVWTLELSEGNA